MVLLPEQGCLDETPLPRLLLDLHRGRFSGALRLHRERVEKTFLFQEGVPIFAESNLASESLGVQLMDVEKISREDFSNVTAYVQRERCKEGKALLDLGLLEPKELFLALKGQVRVRLLECFGWTHGEFTIEPGESPPAEAQPFRADIYALVQEGIESHWSAERILSDLSPNMQRCAARTSRLSRIQPRLRWDDAVQAFIDALDGTRTLWMALQTASTPRALAAAWLLDAADAVAYRDVPRSRHGPREGIAPEIEIVGIREAEPAPPQRPARAPVPEREQRVADAAVTAALRREITDKHERLGELDFYELLELDPRADAAEIRRSYLEAAKTYHPDALAHSGLDAKERRQAGRVFTEIGKAYAVLSDPERRKGYDAARTADEPEPDADKLAMAETLYRKGEVLLRRGNFAGALEFLKPATDLWPEDGAYQSALGWALYKKMPSEPKAARVHLERAAALEPKDAVVFFRLSVVLRALGEVVAASGAMGRAKRLDPNIG